MPIPFGRVLPVHFGKKSSVTSRSPENIIAKERRCGFGYVSCVCVQLDFGHTPCVLVDESAVNSAVDFVPP